MSKTIFQFMGGLALVFSALLLLGGTFTIVRYPPSSPWHVLPLIAVVVTLIIGGLGLFYLRKWAALLVSVLALWVATWELKDALHPIPGRADWLGFVFAILLAIPLILTAVSWRTLLWRGEQKHSSRS